MRTQSNTTDSTPNDPSSVAPSGAPSFILKATAMLIGMFAFLQVYSVQSILPVLMMDFHASEVQVGMAVGATVMAVALMSPFLGMLSDAIGRKSLIVGALFFLAVPTALIANSQDIETLTFWRFSKRSPMKAGCASCISFAKWS